MRSTSSREEQFPGAHELGAECALERNAEKAYSFQLTGTRKGPCVNRTQAARFDQLRDRGLRYRVVTDDEDIERLTSHRPSDQRSGEGGIERLDHPCPLRNHPGDLLRIRTARRGRQSIVGRVEGIGNIHQNFSGELRVVLLDDLRLRGVWDGQNHYVVAKGAAERDSLDGSPVACYHLQLCRQRGSILRVTAHQRERVAASDQAGADTAG